MADAFCAFSTVLGISEANETLISEDFKSAVTSIFTSLAERFTKVLLHSDILFSMSSLKRTQDKLVRTIRQQSTKKTTSFQPATTALLEYGRSSVCQFGVQMRNSSDLNGGCTLSLYPRALEHTVLSALENETA
ncbi:hypothetical protein MSG28_004338 [Choristoneura fumiferana]|uniref:Uncharacterized protein n=1 Tax=Choristoneura fumiferana TaxID=7141 RepID=A0ACC0KIH2_CHOFU|nr:hypothetical protein MSG28_004338 [Choristoneura fumiferana]